MAKKASRRRDNDFITRGPGMLGKDDREAEEFHLEQKATELFREAGFGVVETRGVRTSADFLVQRHDFGRDLTYSIEVIADLGSKRAEVYTKRFLDRLRVDRKPNPYDEYWLITNRLREDLATQRGALDPAIRIYTIDELQELLAPYSPAGRRSAKASARTKIGKATEANERDIQIAIAALILQIDSKLDDLRLERPNSDDAIANRDSRISDYERMRSELENIREMVVQFTKGEVKETQLVKSVTTFREGVKNWWLKGHEGIISRTYDSALFLSSVGVLKLMSADMKTGMIVAGAIIGGKTVVGGLKNLSKKLFGG